MADATSLSDVLAANAKILKKGPSDKALKPRDYALRISDLESPDQMMRTLGDRLSRAQEVRDPWEEKWERAWKAYNQILDTDKEDSWESKRFMPVIHQHVNTWQPNILAPVLNRRKIFHCDGMDPESSYAAEANEALLEYQVRSQTNFEPAIDKAAHHAGLFGTGYIDTGWSHQVSTQLKPAVVWDTDEDGEYILEEGVPQKVKVLQEEEVTVMDKPVVRAPNPVDIWLAPYSEAGDEQDWFFEHQVTTVGRLRLSAGEGHIDADAVNKFVERRKNPDSGYTSESTEGGADVWGKANTRLWDQWLNAAGMAERPDYTTDDYHENDHHVSLMVYRSRTEVITIADGDWIIGYSKSPYMHGKTGLVSYQCFPVADSPYGHGIGTLLLGHQELVNENINRYMDTAALSLMAPIIVNRSSIGVMDKNFVWEPNKIIHARDVKNGAQRMDVPAPTNLALQIDQHLRRDADDTSGYGEQARGLATPGVGTATEFSGLQQNIQNRSWSHVRRFGQFLSRIGTLLVSLNQQFITETQMVKLVGNKAIDYVRVKPWELVGDVKVTCTADPNRANPDMDLQGLIGVAQVTLPFMTGQAGPSGPKIAKMMFEEAGMDPHDLKDLFPEEEARAVRDPLLENVALAAGGSVAPHPKEDFALHIQIHTQAAQEAEANGATPGELARYQEHIEATMAMAAEVGAQEQGGADVQNAQPDATQGGQLGQAQGQAQGAAGTPGAASPGPAAPAGRPL